MSDHQTTVVSSDPSKESNTSLSGRWNAAVGLVESSPLDAIPLLEKLQVDISTIGLFSSNETIDDVGSKSIPLLGLDYYLGMSHLNVPCMGKERMLHLEKGTQCLINFLQRLEQYELLSSDQIKEYQEILELHDNEDDAEVVFGGPRNSNITREQKIARYRAKQDIQEEIQKLQALQERRGRLDVAEMEEMDGHDEESLERKLALSLIQIHVITAMEEWHQAQREVPMVKMMIQTQDRNGGVVPQRPPPPPPSNKPFQVTRITKDIGTGQLNIQKEEIRSQVFRPSWNQPTMTLQELGDIEVAQAREREAKQALAELGEKDKPRRYEQLLKDGQEDNADLVDASAKMDRDWDDFKDANPRGSGNKMGDRGNRNF